MNEEIIKISMKDSFYIELDEICYYVQIKNVSMLSTPYGRSIAITLAGSEV